MKRLIYKFLSALAFSLLLSVFFYWVSHYLSNTINLKNIGGDKSGIFFVVFLGLPLGSSLGLFLIDRVLYRIRGWNIIGLCIGLILSIAGAFLGIFLLSALGLIAVFVVPIIIIISSMIGYQAGFLLINKGSTN